MTIETGMKLLEPIALGRVMLRNRLVMSPMSTNFAKDGFITDQMIAFYHERARGGIGLIFIEDGVVETPRGNHATNIVAIDRDDFIPMLRKLTATLHDCGAQVGIQLTHGGRRAGRVSPRTGCLETTRGVMPVAPSAIAHPVTGHVVPRELTVEEIEELIGRFVEAGRRVVEAGFDVIALHCAHMYLLGQFLSPWANHRCDEYGGTLEKRTRFVLRIIQGIRETVGDQATIICRMNGAEPEGGNTPEEIQEIARRLEHAGAAGLHVSVGFGAPIKDPQFIPSVTPMRTPDMCIVGLAARIKAVVSVPVIAVNKIKDVRAAESVLQEGKADLIAMGRPLIADPEILQKARAGFAQRIRPCIYCCRGCVANIVERDAPLACSTNPRVGKEGEPPLERALRPKRVLVLGAGPAGMQAALTAAARGHKVWLIDVSEEGGGQLRLAAVPPGKHEITRFTDYLRAELAHAPILVEMGRTVTQEWLEEVKADAVVLATGSEPSIPPIPGLSRLPTVTARQVLSGPRIEGREVLVVGGGQVGTEVAEFLCEHGNTVTVVEMLAEIAADMPKIASLPLIMSLERHGVRIMTQARVRQLCEEGAWIECNGRQELLRAEIVVWAVGAQPRCIEIEDVIRKEVSEVYAIGDRAKPGGILEAVRDGYEVGMKL